MTTEELLTEITQQNEIMITLLARLVWTPERLAEIVVSGKKNPDAYLSVYNALDGVITGRQLAEFAGVTQQTISGALQTWQDQSIILNVGTDTGPKYRRLMRVPEKRKVKAKQPAQDKKEVIPPGDQQETNAARP